MRQDPEKQSSSSAKQKNTTQRKSPEGEEVREVTFCTIPAWISVTFRQKHSFSVLMCFKTSTTLICVFSHTVHSSAPLVIPVNTSGRSNLPLQAIASRVGETARSDAAQWWGATCHRPNTDAMETAPSLHHSMRHLFLRNHWKLPFLRQRGCIQPSLHRRPGEIAN